MTLRLKPPAQSPEEWIREADQRMKRLERSRTTRVGDWMLTQNDSGVPVLVKPGAAMALDGSELDPVTLESATRGFVTASEVAHAVSGGTTGNLTAATQTQVDQDIATSDAQYVADNANALAAKHEAILNSGSGVAWSDTFDRPQANDLGAGYFRTESGGVGIYGTTGDGFAASLVANGATPQWWFDSMLTPVTTDSMVVSSTLQSVPAVGGGGGTTPSQHALAARCNATNTDAVIGVVENGFVALGYILGGSYTSVVGGTPVGMVDGDRWDLIAMDGPDPTYVLLRNGLPTSAQWTDFGGVFPVDASHRFGGMRNIAGTTITGFFFTIQIPAPTVQILNVADRV